MESEKKYGIDSLKRVVDFGASTHEAADLAKADGEIDISDIGYAVEPGMALVKLIAVIGQVPKQFADLDEAEKAELIQYAKDEYDVSDDKVEALVERCFRVAIELGDLIEDAISGDDQ